MSSRKPPSTPDDWDDFDIPTWDDSARRTPSRDYPAAPACEPARRATYPDPLYDDYEPPAAPSRPAERTPSRSQQPPRLSSRVPSRTTRPSRQDPYRDPYSEAGEDYASAPPYPRVPEYDTPRPSAASQYDLYADPALDAGWDDATGYEDIQPTPRRSRTSARAARPNVSIPRPAVSDSLIASVVGVAILSLLIMAGVVWYGLGDIAGAIPWHLDASGNVDHWVSKNALWRIPFGSFMAMVIGLAIGGFLWKRDRFAARFVIIALCAVQVLAWVAVIDQLW